MDLSILGLIGLSPFILVLRRIGPNFHFRQVFPINVGGCHLPLVIKTNISRKDPTIVI